MAVLIEALSVVIKIETINAKFPGGWQAFAAEVANGTLCSDGEIARVGFLQPNDVREFLQAMQNFGFVFLNSDRTVAEMAVIGQEEGFAEECAWLDAGITNLDGNQISAAHLRGSKKKELVTPLGWTYQGSISQVGQRIEKSA